MKSEKKCSCGKVVLMTGEVKVVNGREQRSEDCVCGKEVVQYGKKIPTVSKKSKFNLWF